MVAICSDVEPPDGLSGLAELAEVELTESGYISVSEADGSDIATTRPGVYVAGCASGPKNIKESLATAQAAAGGALANLDQRLLSADYVPQAESAADTGVPQSDEEKRVLIEKMLYALLEQR